MKIWVKELKKLLSEINEEARKYKKNIVTIYAISILLSVITIYNSLLNKLVIDEVFYKKNINYLYEKTIYILIFIFVISIVLQLYLYYQNVKLYTEIDLGIKKNYYSKVMNLSYSFLLSINNSELYYRMFRDISSVCEYGLTLFIQVPSAIIYFVLLGSILIYWSRTLALGLFLIVCIQIVIIVLVKEPTQRIIKKQTKIEQELVKQVNTDYRDIIDVKLLNLQNYKMKCMEKCMEKFKNSTISSKFLLQFFGTIGSFINNLWGLMILIFGAIMVYRGTITVGEYMVFSGLSIKAIEPMVTIVRIFLNFQEIRINLSRYQEYLGNEDLYTGKKELAFREKITINKLQFKYSSGNRIILNITSLELSSSTIVGLVGINGSGKTTLMYILGRVINEGYIGDIEIDGNSIEEYSIESYRKKIYVLTQKPFIFEGSLKDNVLLFHDSKDENEIMRSKYFTLIHSLVARLPTGIETEINDTGNNLSVGEKQKIALVRMFLQKPKILLLDEPFTGLDMDSQRDLVELLENYRDENNALIIIASHQGVDLDIFDKKIVLSPGGGYKVF